MKEPKVIQYHHLVSVARQVLLSIKLDKPTSYYEVNELGEMIIADCSSGLYLYGGFAPRNLKVLLTFHEMHKMRKAWLDDYLHKYFKMFFPTLTKKRMWEIITERRLKFRADWRKKNERIERGIEDDRERKVKIKNPYTNRIITDYTPRIHRNNNDRIFPMPCMKYVQFVLSRCSKRKLEDDNYMMWYEHSGVNNSKQVAHYQTKDSLELHDWVSIDNNNIYPYGIDFRILFQKGKMILLGRPEKNRAIDRGYYQDVRDTVVYEGVDEDE